jgi:uncharacterized protein
VKDRFVKNLIAMMGKLDNNQIEDLLQHEIIGRIGCHADGVTYVVPISYAYDGKYIYGHTEEGMKINIMRKNPRDLFSGRQADEYGDLEECDCNGRI